MLERPPDKPAARRAARSRALANARRRRAYARSCQGRRVLNIEVAYAETITALLNAADEDVRHGFKPRLTEAESHDREKIEKVVAETVVGEWVRLWTK